MSGPVSKEQADAIYWLALELAQSIHDGNREPHAEDIAGLRSILPLLRKDQAETIESLLPQDD